MSMICLVALPPHLYKLAVLAHFLLIQLELVE